MKLKADFVTNSSTTSYIVICDGDFTEEDLSQLMGVRKGSPLEVLVKALYKSLRRDLEPVRSAWEIDKKYGGDFETYLKGEFSEKVLDKVKEADKQGRQIYVGSLSSEVTMTESLFCCDSFEWENDKLYINGLNCGW